jgi:sugar (pentulose or hexulose) kinase
VHRFRNEPSGSGQEQHWDAEELFEQTVIGLQRAAAQFDGAADSMGVTAWGVDVGLLDNDNKLATLSLGNVVPMTEESAERIDTRDDEQIRRTALARATLQQPGND